MHILDMVFHWARIDPHRPAIVLPEMITTFGGLADAIESVSSRIDKLDLDRHEPVAVAIANPALFIAVVFALLRCGLSAALANRSLIPHLQPNGIRNLIYDVEGLVASGGRNIRIDNSWLPTGSPAGHLQRSRPVEDANLIFFTSGTTGLPKKFVHTRRGLERRLALQRATADATRKSALVAMGLVAAFGFNQACELLDAGKTACFAASIDASLSLIGVFRIDTVIASAQQVLTMATIKESSPELQVDSLKTIMIGGSSIGRQAIKRIRATLCRNVVSRYGSTEGGLAAIAPFDLLESIPGAVGFVTPWAEVEIVDDAGTPLPNGSEGAIRYRTGQFLGSVGESKDDAAAEQGWFYPGDVGHLTEDDVLCVSGRTTDLVNIGGVKLSTARVEEILQTMPEVREAAACGVEEVSGLERLWVAVVPKGSAVAVELKAKARTLPEIGSEISELFVLPELPRGDLGKIQKAKLKEILLGLKGKS